MIRIGGKRERRGKSKCNWFHNVLWHLIERRVRKEEDAVAKVWKPFYIIDECLVKKPHESFVIALLI